MIPRDTSANIDSRQLWHEAAMLFDREPALRRDARQAWRSGFQSGGEWMAQALSCISPSRWPRAPRAPAGLNRWGLFKYGLCLIPPAATAAAAWAIAWPLIALAPIGFYAVEAQMVFLFPLLLDGAARPLPEGRRLTLAQGGTWEVMKKVGPIALRMLGGPFRGGKWLRSWCLGCLAVAIWYERATRVPFAPSSTDNLTDAPIAVLETARERDRDFPPAGEQPG